MTTSVPIGAPLVYIPDSPADPTPSRALEWGGFLRLVDTVAAAGFPPPPEFAGVRERFGAVQQIAAGDGRAMQRQLTDAVISGGTPGLTALFVAALAERAASATDWQADLVREIRNVVLKELRDIYGTVAGKNYRALAARFDVAADRFAKCARVIDPAAAASAVVDSNRKTLQAWRDAAALAGELDALVEPLACAAELVRPLHMPSGLGVSRDPLLLPLVADVDGLHRRVIWHAWLDLLPPQPPATGLTRAMLEAPPPAPQQTRCGRWARLVSVSATLRAHPRPSEMQLYDPARPIITTVPAGERWFKRIDPEGPLPPEPGPGLLRRMADTLTGRRPEPEPEPEIDIHDTVADADDTE